MRISWLKHELFAAVALGALALPLVAAAGTVAPNEAAPPDAPTPTSGPASSLSEVIVTATKRSSSVQEVPAAITALTSQVLAQRGIVTTEDLQFAAPSLQVGTLLGATGIAIRGVGLNSGSLDTPGVAVYTDGVYQPHPAIGNLLEVDLDRVEVLRGPQGTLYGRNANGGAVNFISNRPTQNFGGYIMGGAATYGEYRVQGAINVPLSPKWAARAVVNYNDRQRGFVKNVIPGNQSLDRGKVTSGRLLLDGDLTDTLAVAFEYAGEHSVGPFSYLTLHNSPTPVALFLNPYFVNATVPLTPLRTSANDPSSVKRRYHLASATVSWASPIGDIKSITAYQSLDDRENVDSDGTNLSAFPSSSRDQNETFTQEVNVSKKIGRVDLISGFYFMHDHRSHDGIYRFPQGFNPGLPFFAPGVPNPLAAPKSYLEYTYPKYDTEAGAIFFDLTWNVTDKFRAIGGVRYSSEHQHMIQHNVFGTYAFGPTTPFFNPCDPANLSASQEETPNFHSLTPRGVLQYDFNKDQNVYGSYSKGYKAGGLNYTACNNSYQPEHITSEEIGYKGRFFDRRLTLAASAFYYDYTNLQIGEIVGSQALVQNAAAARIKGLEMELDFTPDDHFSIGGGVTLLDAKYRKFFNTDGLDPAGVLQDLSGRYLNNAPRVSANIGASYRTGEQSWGALMGRIDVSYRSRTYFREFNQPLDAQSAFALFNLSLTWDDPSKTYSARLFANNVTNVGYITTMGTANTFGARFVTWGRPRQVGIELKANF